MQELEHLGWTSFFESQISADERGRVARVVADWGSRTTVVGMTGERSATARGRAVSTCRPAVGDWVILADQAPDLDLAVIERVLERRSALSRRAAGAATTEQVMAANVDVVFVVQGLDGDFNLRRLERTVTAVWESGAEPVVILNKLDLADDAADRTRESSASVPGVAVYAVCARDGRGLDEIVAHLGVGRTGAMIGSSGAGKSTILNHLLGVSLQRTAAVRTDDSRGRHTTTARVLFRLPGGGLLVDGPGIRELQLWRADTGIDATFADIAELAAQCRYRDCAHEDEPGCAVAEAVADGQLAPERLASFYKLRREAAFAARQRDVFARRAEARRWRAIHRSLRNVPNKRD